MLRLSKLVITDVIWLGGGGGGGGGDDQTTSSFIELGVKKVSVVVR